MWTFIFKYKWIWFGINQEGYQHVSLSYNLHQSEAATQRCSENMQQIYRRTPMPKSDLNKVTKQLYWNHPSARVNTFSWEHLWTAASDHGCCSRPRSASEQQKSISSHKAFLQVFSTLKDIHCVKRVRIRSYSGQHFSRIRTDRIQSKCGKIREKSGLE